MQGFASLDLPPRRPAPMPVKILRDGEEVMTSPPAPFDYFHFPYYNVYDIGGNQWFYATPFILEMSIAGDDL